MSSSPKQIFLPGGVRCSRFKTMHMIYNLLGRLCFSHQQGWEQRKSAKIMVFTVAFALALGLVLAAVIRLMYYHKK
jgi:hypothetical protein